jgi:hypothetical protein
MDDGWPSAAPLRRSGLVGLGHELGRFAMEAGLVRGGDVLEQLVEELFVVAGLHAGSALTVDGNLHSMDPGQ